MQQAMFTGKDVLDGLPVEAPESLEQGKAKPDAGRDRWPIAKTVVFATVITPCVWGMIIAAVTLVG